MPDTSSKTGLFGNIRKSLSRQTEQQRRFLKRHLSAIIAPIFLGALGILMIPFALYHDSIEHQIDLVGHLSTMRLSRGSDPANSTFYFAIKESQKLFKVSGLSLADQQMLADEASGSEFKFTVQQDLFYRDPYNVPVLQLSTSKNVYLRDYSISLIRKRRYMAAFLSCICFLSAIVIARKLRKEWLRFIVTPFDPEKPGEMDPIVVWIACNFRLAVGLAAASACVLCAVTFPHWLRAPALGVFVLLYAGFLYWYQKRGQSIAWIKTVIEADKKSRTVERPGTLAPKYIQAIELLIQKAGDVNVRNGEGKTPLWIAAAAGHVEAVGHLLRKGALTDLPDNNGATPLMIAAEKGFLGVVMKLIEGKADLLLLTPSGDTALACAQRNKNNRGTIDVLLKATRKAEAKKKAEEEAALAEAKKKAEAGEPAEGGPKVE